jgi:hypothetical protein
MTSGSYLRHYGPPIISLYVAEGHLRAFVLVDLELRVVDERDLVHGCYTPSAACTRKIGSRSCGTSILNNDSRHANSSVGRHLDWTQSTSLVALLTQLRRAIYNMRGQPVRKLGYRGRCSTYLVGDRLLCQC